MKKTMVMVAIRKVNIRIVLPLETDFYPEAYVRRILCLKRTRRTVIS